MKYDAAIVGTGFASSFFLRRLFQKQHVRSRVLALERGRCDTLSWQMKNALSSSYSAPTFKNATPAKSWTTNIAFGGGSNCWWACTPRMLPNDFRLKTLYGIGRDWPLEYDDLEAYYDDAERVMSVTGSSRSPFSRSGPYPQPPHAHNKPELLLQKAYPEQVFAMPTARASIPTKNRPKCCGTSHCNICPTDSKFTIRNELQHLFEDDRVTLKTNVKVESVVLEGGLASGVLYSDARGKEHTVRAELVVLGANAIGNPEILLRSGINHGPVGENLNEQVGLAVHVYLDGLESLQGGSSITGHAYNLYDGPHRSERAACLIELHNRPLLRAETGRWREKLMMKCILENLPQSTNTVTLPAEPHGLPVTFYPQHSDYAARTIERLPDDLARFLSPLPVEDIIVQPAARTEGHIMGTTVMGDDPATSVVDRNLVHHKVRNLVVLGSGVFPSTAPANPTLTLSALSTWSVDRIFSR